MRYYFGVVLFGNSVIVQVVGRKSVWLAPPSVSSSMYPFVKPSDNEPDHHLPSSELGNTSKVDVFAEAHHLQEYPDFVQRVIPAAMTATLGPGDMLFFPPGWWHAMRSETTSFSFSFWFWLIILIHLLVHKSMPLYAYHDFTIRTFNHSYSYRVMFQKFAGKSIFIWTVGEYHSWYYARED